MKWLFPIAALLLIGVFFYSRKPAEEGPDPNKPWLSLAPAPASSEEKEAKAEDPRSLDDLILQKDYCAASEYFRFGRRASELKAFPKKIWPERYEDRRELRSDTLPILEAQFAGSRQEAIAKLKGRHGADMKLLLGMLQAGLAGNFRDSPTSHDLLEALVSLDEAEDLYPNNSLVPIYRAMLMKKQGASMDGIAKFLREELPKRPDLNSPLSGARFDYLALVSRDPHLFAAAAPTFQLLEDSRYAEVESFLAEASAQDPAVARLVVSVADQWQKSELEKLAPGIPDQFNQLGSLALAARIGASAFAKAYPGVQVPDRFEERQAAQQASRHRDRNPIEARLYFGEKREASCGRKWQEAVEADFEMVRDRLRKRAVR